MSTEKMRKKEMKFCTRLRAVRDKLSQAKMAEKLGIPQQTYSGWESGAHQPKLEMLEKISLMFSVTTDWLLGLTDVSCGNATATNGSAAATGNARATVNASADTDRLLRIIESQQAVIATLAASVQGAYAASVAAEK